jgi:hypothetical protein
MVLYTYNATTVCPEINVILLVIAISCQTFVFLYICSSMPRMEEKAFVVLSRDQ